MVKMQFQASVQGWISDFGGEYKSTTYDDLLKGEGIRIYNSAPHIPQQNGCTERFMHTQMDKAAMHHMACLPDETTQQARRGTLGNPSKGKVTSQSDCRGD